MEQSTLGDKVYPPASRVGPGGISCLPSVVGSIVAAGRPCLKFARMLDEAYGLRGGRCGTLRPTSSRSRTWARGRVARKELYDPRSMRRILTSLGALWSWSGVTEVDPAAGKAACRFACEIIDWACSLSSSNQTALRCSFIFKSWRSSFWRRAEDDWAR